MAYPKFILTSDGHLRLGMVNLHKHLLQHGEHCAGGGFYRFDHARLALVLDGESMDYGPPRWDRFARVIVDRLYQDLTITYNGITLSDLATIEYE